MTQYDSLLVKKIMLHVSNSSSNAQANLIFMHWGHLNALGMEIPLPWNNIPKKYLERKMKQMWESIIGSLVDVINTRSAKS